MTSAAAVPRLVNMVVAGGCWMAVAAPVLQHPQAQAPGCPSTHQVPACPLLHPNPARRSPQMRNLRKRKAAAPDAEQQQQQQQQEAPVPPPFVLAAFATAGPAANQQQQQQQQPLAALATAGPAADQQQAAAPPPDTAQQLAQAQAWLRARAQQQAQAVQALHARQPGRAWLLEAQIMQVMQQRLREAQQAQQQRMREAQQAQQQQLREAEQAEQQLLREVQQAAQAAQLRLREAEQAVQAAQPGLREALRTLRDTSLNALLALHRPQRVLYAAGEFDAAFEAGPAQAAPLLLGWFQLAPALKSIAAELLPVVLSMPYGVAYIALGRRDTPGDRWAGAGLAWEAVSGWPVGACCETVGGVGCRESLGRGVDPYCLPLCLVRAQRACFACCGHAPLQHHPPGFLSALHRSWPYSPEAIFVLDGEGGTPVAPADGYNIVAGSERAVVMQELLRPLVTGEHRMRPLGPVRRLAQPEKEAGKPSFAYGDGMVSWVVQVLGAPWGTVCLPLIALALAVGSCPAHPRTEGKRVDFKICISGFLLPIRWRVWGAAAAAAAAVEL